MAIQFRNFWAGGLSGQRVSELLGVDNNQNYISPGNIIASMVKRIDEAVYATVEDVVEGNFEGGVNIEYGLAEEGVGLTTLEAEVDEIILPSLDQDEIDKIINMKEEVTVPHADKIEDIKQKMIEGEIEVTN